MTTKEFETKYANEIKKGEFVKASWQSITIKDNIEYKKVSNGVVRFVQYGHINGVQVVGKVNPNEQVLIPNTLYHNTKTNNTLVQLATTKVKAHCHYFINGVESDKATFEATIKPRKPQLDANGQPLETIVFRVKVENLLTLGE